MENNTQYLQSLGLTEYQSRIMIVLFSRKSAGAKELCALTGIRHTKIYQVLKSLEYLGFIHAEGVKPRQYISTEPNKVLNNLITKHQQRIDLLRKEKTLQLRIFRKLDFSKELAGLMKNAQPYIERKLTY